MDQDEVSRIRAEEKWKSDLEARLKAIEAGLAELAEVRDKVTAWAWRLGGVILLSMLPQFSEVIHMLLPGIGTP